MTTPCQRPLICSRCGEKQPTDGALTTDDGTPISIPQYVALAGLVDSALVCSDCVTASALTPAIGQAQAPCVARTRECRDGRE
ncbi:hypothetical protein FHU33_3616 [Blastococcus colisei]|uniref:Uncharacterized protein n=1 Tax=Blastococcus colisei TaxID=1564162 RepID=A0A543PJ80_9ACTN|nr:hypothetical protein FHU33_3616 [Blastococcus colisei]